MPAIPYKIDCFEYSIDKLIKWYQEVNGDSDGWKSNFTKLKLIKLNFFLSAVNANEGDEGLLDIFDNFYAMPYGHVESDIYANIEGLKKYVVTNKSVDFVNEGYDYAIPSDITDRIDRSIESLKAKNINLINYGAFKLVELSHQWYSWINMFNLARMRGDNSIEIPVNLIKTESKLFELPEYASF